MLDTRPKENESLSWLWVGLWTMLILATIPLARAIGAVSPGSDSMPGCAGDQASGMASKNRLHSSW